MENKLRLTDLLVTFVISVVFGILYHFWIPFYNVLKPFGLHVEQLSYGFWFMAATVAFLIIRKPGVALLAEFAAASGEIFLGGSWGAITLLYGFIQGLFAELILWLFHYRPSLLAVSLAGLASGIGSFGVDWIAGYLELAGWNLSLLVGFRLFSSVLFAGWFAYVLVQALEKMGTISMLRTSDPEEVDKLDHSK